MLTELAPLLTACNVILACSPYFTAWANASAVSENGINLQGGWKEVVIRPWNCEIIMSKNHGALRNPFSKLWIMFSYIFQKGRRLPTASNQDDKCCAPPS